MLLPFHTAAFSFLFYLPHFIYQLQNLFIQYELAFSSSLAVCIRTLQLHQGSLGVHMFADTSILRIELRYQFHPE